MTIHCRVLCPMWRSCWIEGRATFTIAMSRTTMNCATHDRNRMIPFLVFTSVVMTRTLYLIFLSGVLLLSVMDVCQRASVRDPSGRLNGGHRLHRHALSGSDDLVDDVWEVVTDDSVGDEAQGQLVAGLVEEAFAGPEHERVDHQPQLVDEIVVDQCVHELETGGHDDFPVQPLLQLRHLSHGVAPQNRGVLP